jgi:hypothetical protein
MVQHGYWIQDSYKYPLLYTCNEKSENEIKQFIVAKVPENKYKNKCKVVS